MRRIAARLARALAARSARAPGARVARARAVRRVEALVAVLAAASLGACQLAAQRVPLATSEPPAAGQLEACPNALLASVRLEGDPAQRPAVWVVGQDGRRLSILWRHGFSARFTPRLELLDEDGDVVAREGDVLNLGGVDISEEFDWFACEVAGSD